MMIRSIVLGVMMVAALATARPCEAKVRNLAPSVRRELARHEERREIARVAELPPAVVALIAERMADPGQPWEATDVIVDAKLPRTRLIWAARVGELFVVHYERGGFAHSFHVIAARVRKSGEAEVVWHAAGGRLESYAAFLAALSGDRLDDDRRLYR
jgi:hypothetical protein